jgi:hypothetical protein
MKIVCWNREEDGMPLLQFEAEDKADIKTLERLHKEIKQAQTIASVFSLAGDFNACGASFDNRRKISHITCSLLLGMHSLDVGNIKGGIRRSIKA